MATFLANSRHRKSLPQLADEPEVQAKFKDEVPFTQKRRQKPLNRELPPIRRLVKSRLILRRIYQCLK